MLLFDEDTGVVEQYVEPAVVGEVPIDTREPNRVAESNALVVREFNIRAPDVHPVVHTYRWLRERGSRFGPIRAFVRRLKPAGE